MTFNEAIALVFLQGKTVIRCCHNFSGEEDDRGPWSEWVRMRLDSGTKVESDSVLEIETCHRDGTFGHYITDWDEDQLDREDYVADNWLVEG